MNTLNMALIAAPVQQTPNSPIGGYAAGGATLVGLILAALIINNWKGMSKEAKKYTVMGMFMIACLAGGGGVLGGLIESGKTTAGTVGTTLTSTTTGQ